MKTFENSRVRVTVPDETVERYYQRYADMRGNGETPEQSVRGKILSDAISMIASGVELERLESEPLEIDPEEVFRIAEHELWFDYLLEHTKYRKDEVTRRVLGGHQLLGGMAEESAIAHAWAHGVLYPDESRLREDFRKEAQKTLSPDGEMDDREFNKIHKRYLAKLEGMASGKAKEALQQARESLASRRKVVIDYRRDHTTPKSWKIEVIGAMPEQVGTCVLSGESQQQMGRAALTKFKPEEES
jgi:hypothetical protein